MSGSGLLLAIEASNPSLGVCEVALAPWTGGGSGALLGHEPIGASTRERDDLVPAIERLTARLGVDRRDIRRVAVSVGPGGYTAIRMAVAAGAMVAESLGAMCQGVPTAGVAAAARTDSDFPLAVALAHKGESAHVTVFTEPGGRGAWPAGRVVGLEGMTELARGGVRRLVADAALPAALVSTARGAGMAVEPVRLSAAGLVRAAGWADMAGIEPVDPASLRPLYAREPEAVTLWRARHGGGSAG